MAAGEIDRASSSRLIDTPEGKLHYHEAGEGPPLIMLHGGGLGPTGWGEFHHNFAALAQRHRTFLVDLPGYGGSDPGDLSMSITEAGALAVLRLMDANGIERASLGGNAMKATLWFALHYPERLDHLIVMGPASSGRSDFVPTPTEGSRALSAIRGNATPESVRALLELWAYNPASVSDEMVADHLAGALSRSPSRPAQPELNHRLAEIKAKTLIIWGRDNRQVALDESLRLLSLIPGAQLHVFQCCGHWPELEHPAEFSRVLLGFLSDIPR
jgi:pimeloyl-ACP methyl ester carboxylesterase